MKKYLFVMFLGLSCVFTRVHAVEQPLPTVPVASPTPIEYVMPYPGLLPTHPLYFLKSLRDRIIEQLITDPVKKAEFYILQADKRVGMAVLLHQQGKQQDALASHAKALVHREEAIKLLENISSTHGSIPGFVLEKLKRSLLKHREQTGFLSQETETMNALLTRVEALTIVSE